MLRQFVFSNFKSFKDEAFLDLTAENITEHEETLIVDPVDNEKHIPAVVIYGPNGGGKSTVLEALNYVQAHVLYPVVISQMGPDNNLSPTFLSSKAKCHKFNSKCESLPISFDLLFRIKDKEFKYQISFLDNEICEENLYERYIVSNETIAVFERFSEEGLNLGEELKGLPFDKVKKSITLLGHIAANYDIDVIDAIVQWFLNIMVIDYNNPHNELNYLLPSDKTDLKKIYDILKNLDIPILGLRFVKDSEGEITDVYAEHKLANGEKVEIPFEEESSGTRKLFTCLSRILDCIERGSVLVADELDAKLHPKLLRYIIELFKNKNINTKGSQILLTSHDLTTMTSDLYRRDEIWFCAKNPDEASFLYSLASLKKENGKAARKDEMYGKQYLEGRYGADPYIRRILDWNDS